MWFWWFMLGCDLLVPAIMIIAGWSMWKHCPKKVNMAIGYRTKRSMKNMDTWQFAHEYCGKLWWRIGWVMLALSVLVQIPNMHSSEDRIGTMGGILCTVQTMFLMFSIVPTEAALRRRFTKDGERI